LRIHFRNAFEPKVKAVVRLNPEEYIGYFEDLNRAPNAEIGSKDFPELFRSLFRDGF